MLYYDFILNISNLTINRFQMGRKISKQSKKSKPKLTRSSSIQKTINEGNDYINRADSRRRARRTQNTHATSSPHTKISKKGNQAKRQKKTKGKVQKSLPSRPKSVPPPSTPAPPVIAALPATLSRSGTRNLAKTSSKNSQIIEQQLHDRLTRHNANIGKLNFSLRWWDPNDLDLHVICPCGTEIFYAHKKCDKCGGELDININNYANPSLQPVEHVYFNKPKKGLYKFYVKYFCGLKEYQGVRGGISSKYELSLHEDLNQMFRYEDNVSQKQTEMHYDFNL